MINNYGSTKVSPFPSYYRQTICQFITCQERWRNCRRSPWFCSLTIVVAYVVVQKRRRRSNTNVFTDMLDLANKLQKEEKELEEPEQEERSTTTRLQFSISPY